MGHQAGRSDLREDLGGAGALGGAVVLHVRQHLRLRLGEPGGPHRHLPRSAEPGAALPAPAARRRADQGDAARLRLHRLAIQGGSAGGVGAVVGGLRGEGGRAAWGAATPWPRAAPPGSRPRIRACRAAITDRVSAYVVETGHVPHEIDRGLNSPASQLGLMVQAAAVGVPGANQHLPGRHRPPLGFASRVLSTRGMGVRLVSAWPGSSAVDRFSASSRA